MPPAITDSPTERHLAAHIAVTPPLSLIDAIEGKFAPIPYNRIVDLAPENPHDALHWHLQRAAILAGSIGLDERTLIGMVSNHYVLNYGDAGDTAVTKFWNAYSEADSSCEGV